MDKNFWLNQVLNSLELVKLNPTNRGIKALKSMLRKYEKNFNEKLDITLPEPLSKNEQKYKAFEIIYSETNNCNHDVS